MELTSGAMVHTNNVVDSLSYGDERQPRRSRAAVRRTTFVRGERASMEEVQYLALLDSNAAAIGARIDSKNSFQWQQSRCMILL